MEDEDDVFVLNRWIVGETETEEMSVDGGGGLFLNLRLVEQMSLIVLFVLTLYPDEFPLNIVGVPFVFPFFLAPPPNTANPA